MKLEIFRKINTRNQDEKKLKERVMSELNKE